MAQEPGTKPASEFVGFREDLMRVNRLQAFVVLLMLALACLRAHAQPAMPVNPPLPDRELVIATREVPPVRDEAEGRELAWHQHRSLAPHRRAAASALPVCGTKTNQEILDGVVKGHVRCRASPRSPSRPQRERTVDFTLPYYTAGLGVAVSTGEPRWRAIFRTLFSFGFLQAVVDPARPRDVRGIS